MGTINMLTKADIGSKLINNDALFNNIYVIQQKFDIIPDKDTHIGASIAYQDMKELRSNFLNELYDTIVDWVYDSEKYQKILEAELRNGKSRAAASSAVQRKAKEKFRGNGKSDKLLVQGQMGELLLFHFIQKFMKATPLIRKMKITTSSDLERFGADAIHYRKDDDKNVFVLGEAKVYTSDYQFNSAFKNSLDSILDTYDNFSQELKLYVHEDFLSPELDEIAESYLSNTIANPYLELVCIVMYNENKKIDFLSGASIYSQIEKIIKERFKNFDNSKIDIENHPILSRINYIVFPVWKLEELATEFQNKI